LEQSDAPAFHILLFADASCVSHKTQEVPFSASHAPAVQCSSAQPEQAAAASQRADRASDAHARPVQCAAHRQAQRLRLPPPRAARRTHWASLPRQLQRCAMADAELAELVAALSGTDAAATRAALHALAAPAVGLPPGSAFDSTGEPPVVARWKELCSTAMALGLAEPIVALLADERFTDDALALLVPVLAALLDCTGLYGVGLEAALVRLLAHSVAHPAVPLQRTERVLRALTDLQKLLVARGALAELVCEEAFLPSLVALLRRQPADERDCLAGGAARLLRELCETGEVVPFGALSAAVAALPASVHSLPCDYGCAYGIHAAMRPCCDLVCFVGAVRGIKPFDDAALELVRDLFVAQPGSFAALMHSMTFVEVLAERDARLIVQLASELVQASWFARTPLLDVHISAYDLGEALQFHHPERDIQLVGDGTLRRIIDVCSRFMNEELLDHVLTEQRIAALATVALLELFDGLVDNIKRLQALLRACFSHLLTEPGDVPAGWLHAAQHQLRSRKLLAAVDALAVHAASQGTWDDDDAPPAAKRLRPSGTAAVSLTAESVNVQRYDSLTLLVSGRPLYVNGMLLEAASPLLADLLSVAARDAPGESRQLPAPVAVPPPADVDPAAFYDLCCAAVEHTYTSDVQSLPESSLMPLWCVARHLQMAVLQQWCAARLAPALRCDEALLCTTGGLALRYRCDALLAAVSTALLHKPLKETLLHAVLDAAVCGGDAAARAATGEVLADALALALQDAFRGTADEA
jgi:hypothetical protein